MAEVVTGKSWDGIFASELRAPLGLGAEAISTPGPASPWAQPSAHRRRDADDHERIREGAGARVPPRLYRGRRLINDALFTAQATEPYPKAVIGDSPVGQIGLDYHYGLANWLECPPPAVNCPVQSSPGAFGFTPWVDRTGGYYAILGMDVGGRRTGVVKFSVLLAEQLRPMIREAMRQ